MTSADQTPDASIAEQRPGEKAGEAEFHFPNGDSYSGGYKIWPEEKLKTYGIMRHGEGTYITHDGGQYSGTWADDCLEGRGRYPVSGRQLVRGHAAGGPVLGPGSVPVPGRVLLRGQLRRQPGDRPGSLGGCRGTAVARRVRRRQGAQSAVQTQPLRALSTERRLRIAV